MENQIDWKKECEKIAAEVADDVVSKFVNNEEIDLKQNFDDEDAGLIPADEAVEFEGENVAYEGDFEGFEIGDMNEESDEFADYAGFGYSEEDM